MLIARRSPLTGDINTMELPVTYEQYALWESGEVIQNAMPHLSIDEREFILNGFLPGEFEIMMGSEE
jgi:hypothetical protein